MYLKYWDLSIFAWFCVLSWLSSNLVLWLLSWHFVLCCSSFTSLLLLSVVNFCFKWTLVNTSSFLQTGNITYCVLITSLYTGFLYFRTIQALQTASYLSQQADLRGIVEEIEVFISFILFMTSSSVWNIPTWTTIGRPESYCLFILAEGKSYKSWLQVVTH